MIEYIFPTLFIVGATIFIAIAFPSQLDVWFGAMITAVGGYIFSKTLGSK